jgi:DNA-binding NarL/FixJ family response regulator
MSCTENDTMEPAGESGGAASPLSAREREVLRLVGQGLTDHAIALRLGIARSTVSFHMSNIMAKLGAASRAAAVASALRRGWLK